MLALASCRRPVPVHEVDPASPCAQLTGSYPSEHGLVVFADDTATVRAMPLCFPGVEGFGVMGRGFNVAVTRPGTLALVITDVRPATRFAAASIDGHCRADNTGKRYRQLGHGTAWTLPVVPGAYCISMIPETKSTQDTWFTLTVTRP